MQLSLFSTFDFPAGSWARPAYHNQQAIVIWIADPYIALQTGLTGKLKAVGQVQGTTSYAGGVALCLRCAAGTRLAILNTLPRPVSHGSQTAGVELPW
jgi:hypothetical protein